MDFDFELEEKRVLKWYRTSQIKAGKISESISIFITNYNGGSIDNSTRILTLNGNKSGSQTSFPDFCIPHFFEDGN